jgi:hypothetical protein
MLNDLKAIDAQAAETQSGLEERPRSPIMGEAIDGRTALSRRSWIINSKVRNKTDSQRRNGISLGERA